MEILEDPVFKIKYQKYKKRVKLWESRFIEKHGRKPNKNDIKEADMKIKESYKMYWKLKTHALEETLMDITFSDEVKSEDDVTPGTLTNVSVEGVKEDEKLLNDDCEKDKRDTGDGNERKEDEKLLNDDTKCALQSSSEKDKRATGDANEKNIEKNDEKDVESTNKENVESTNKKNIENIDRRLRESQSASNALAITENEYKNVKGVWGDHLSKSNEQMLEKKQVLLVGRSSSFQLSRNKFTSSNFIKRNPRKSLSTSKIKNKSEKDRDSSANTSERTINTAATNEIDMDDKNKGTKSIFGEQVKVTFKEYKPATQSIDVVQQVIGGYTVNRNLNSGWLSRCAKENNLKCPVLEPQRLSGTSDSGIESMESSIRSPRENIPVSQPERSVRISDEEDFVCNSDLEEERKSKRVRNFRKECNNRENYPSKRMCTDDGIHAPIILNGREVQAIDDTTSSKAECSASNNTDIIAVTSNNISINNNINIKTNVTSNVDECNYGTKDVPRVTNKSTRNEENMEKPCRERLINRKIRRRIKRISSDDDDPDYNESDEEEKRGEKKISKLKRTTTRKAKTNDESTSTTEKPKAKSNAKVRRTSGRKKQIRDEDDALEIGNDAELEVTSDKKPEIYGIETLKAVPRFVMNKCARGDLIQQFAKSVSSKSHDLTSSLVSAKCKEKLTDKEKLEKKIADGKINENFVRIDIKKKVFVRGKKNFNFSKYKKNQWKQRKKELGSSEGSLEVADFIEKNGGVLSCFMCGDVGHFSRNCPNRKSDDLISLDEVDDSSEFPTLEEAERMANQSAILAHGNRIDRLPEKPSYSTQTESKLESTKNEIEENTDCNELWEPIEDEIVDEILCGHKIPEDLVQKLIPPEIGKVQPLYKLKEDQSLIETPPEVFQALRNFGHETFRHGQEKAVMRILSGQSTLVTLSTGSGKSLCYQLPAYLYSKYSNCITLVISPLVSLMDDQVTGVPAFLSAACLHTNQTQKIRDNVMQTVKKGKLNILLISPEAVVAGEKSTGFGALLRQLPPIAFACIDEAHCISQWSHNFRPSYLMICRVLKEKLGVKTVLALTATATKSTAESIISHLGIRDGMAGVISDIPMPKNLLLTVSKDENRDNALTKLLLSDRFQECNSIIIYCTRREECVRISGLLRAILQNANNPEKMSKTLSPIAEAYHAGLSAHRRKIVQKAFMNGQTRIVVATVAFGMGLNKPDIRAVIHYNMPGTFEGYVQEVGRAGRDGLLAHCHLFLNPKEDNDKWELRRHIYANGVDRHSIRRLLQKVFIPCSCAKLREKNAGRRCPGHEVAIPIDETVAALDISEEIISTLLCYLELHPKRFVTVLSSVYVRARVSSYSGPQALKQAAQSSPPLAMAIALDLQKGISHENSSVIEFPIVDVASAIGWDSGVVKSHLKNLEWKTVNGTSKRSAISVRYDKLGLRVKAPGDLTDVELDEALDAIVSRVQSQENSALQQLETIGVTLHKFSTPTVNECSISNDEVTDRSNRLKDVIRKYFAGEVLLDGNLKQHNDVKNEAQIASDVRNLIVSYRDNNFTGRAVARIFHGIQSPNYPAYVWNKCRFWRAHLSCNFDALCQIATKEILALR